MEATASGALLRRVAFAPRRACGDGGMTSARNRLAMVKMENKFKDQGHLRYYAAATPVMCGPKKEEKRKMKLVKGLEKDLSALHSIGFDDVKGQDQGQTISEAAEALLSQLTKLRAEAKEMKQRRKQEKAAMKAAMMKDRAAETSSSSESSDSECGTETVVKMSRSSLRTAAAAAASDPVAAAALQAEDVSLEAKSNLVLNREPQRCSGSAEVALKPTEGKIEVCMGGKCKKSGAMELMAEFEKKVGGEGAVVGCKCMGKCRDGPNVRVTNQSASPAGDALMMKIAKGPLCIGVGLEDVGPIVAKFLGESTGVVLQPA